MKKKLIATALFIMMAWSSLIYGQNTCNFTPPNGTSTTNKWIHVSKVIDNSTNYSVVVNNNTIFPEIYKFKIANHNNLKKCYLVYKPNSYNAANNTKHKVVFYLPGSSQAVGWIDMTTNFITKALSRGYIVVTIPHTQWFDIEIDADPLTFKDCRFSLIDNTGNINNSLKLVTDLKMLDIIAVKITYDLQSNTGATKVDDKKIYLCGWSSGAFLTQAAAMYLNHRFAAFGSNAGLALNTISTFKPNFKIPIILFNGTKDAKSLYDDKCTPANIDQQLFNNYKSGKESAREWLRISGLNKNLDACPNETNPFNNTFTYDVNPNDNKKVLEFKNTEYFKFLKIVGGGHHWHQQNVAFPCDDTTLLTCALFSLDINTTDIMLDFFEKHSLCTNGNLPNRAFPISNFDHLNQKPRMAQNPEEDVEIGTELSQSYKIYPSLVEDIVNVELENDTTASYSISLINIFGQIIEKQMLNGKKDEVTKTTFNTATLSPNLYFIQIEKNGEKIITEKIIKK